MPLDEIFFRTPDDGVFNAVLKRWNAQALHAIIPMTHSL
ncbi:MAG: hypothetical protein RJB38_2363 [Pseudomonadota bacterium]|jgi:hypothetical protein